MDTDIFNRIKAFLRPIDIDQQATLIQALAEVLQSLQATTAKGYTEGVLRLITELEDSHRKLLAQNRSFAEEIANYQRTEQELRLANESLRNQLLAYKSALTSATESNSGSSMHPTESPIVLGIHDLTKRNEEAVFNALNHFGKKCPYCGKAHFEGGIRDKIEIDHFFPVARGGQDVPWNLLPVCRECNRKKKDKLPIEFLDEDVFFACNTYLLRVQDEFRKEGIDSYQTTKRLRALIESNDTFLKAHRSSSFIKELVQCVSPNRADVISRKPKETVDESDKDELLAGIIAAAIKVHTLPKLKNGREFVTAHWLNDIAQASNLPANRKTSALVMDATRRVGLAKLRVRANTIDEASLGVPCRPGSTITVGSEQFHLNHVPTTCRLYVLRLGHEAADVFDDEEDEGDD